MSVRCIDGRLMRHDPQPDDPSLETDIGKCEECDGEGCIQCVICGRMKPGCAICGRMKPGVAVDCKPFICNDCVEDEPDAAEFAHLGDPCVYCGVAHDDVPVGPCKGLTYTTTGITDIEWLDAKVVEYGKKFGKVEYERDAYKRALVAIIRKAREMEAHANVAQCEWNSGEASGADRVADIARNVIPEGEY